MDLLEDDNDQVGMDELEPPARAIIRAMLTELNSSPDDASFQLAPAVHNVDRRTGLDTVRRALTMTIGLLHWSGQSDRLEAVMNSDTTANEADVRDQNQTVREGDEDRS